MLHVRTQNQPKPCNFLLFLHKDDKTLFVRQKKVAEADPPAVVQC